MLVQNILPSHLIYNIRKNNIIIIVVVIIMHGHENERLTLRDIHKFNL